MSWPMMPAWLQELTRRDALPPIIDRDPGDENDHAAPFIESCNS